MNLTFPELLRFHRLRLDISQTKAAQLLETPLRTYQGWELGHCAPNKITRLVVATTLESLKTELFIPTKIKRGRPANREVIVLKPALV
jgi:DNA-binding XRE family transcriptional regulator